MLHQVAYFNEWEPWGALCKVPFLLGSNLLGTVNSLIVQQSLLRSLWGWQLDKLSSPFVNLNDN